MAQLTSSGQINGTSVKGTLSYELSSRTGTSFTIKFNHTIAMNSATASTDAGYETYTAYITVSGTNITTNTVNMTVKPASIGLSGLGDSYSTSNSFTFYTTSGAATTANIKFYVNTNKNAYGSVVNTSTSSSGSLSVKAGYTSVTEPTSVTVTNIVKPDGEATITWSGAKAGISNSISGYYLKYSYDSGSTWSDEISVSNSPYNFTVPSTATRGATIKAQVQTRGSAGNGWHSSYKDSTSNGKVNSLPTISITKVSKTEVKSDGDTVTFTVSAADEDTSQTKTLYYSTTETGTKIKFTSPLSRIITKDSNIYYFWAYDGLEYSDSVSSTIEVNEKPSIESSSIGYSDEKFYNSYENSIEKSSYYLYTQCNFTLSKPNCYYYIYALTSNNTYDLTGKLQASDTSVNKTCSLAMRELVGKTITGIKIKVIDPKFPTDYIESTYVPIFNSEEIKSNFIPEIIFVNSYNQIANTNIKDGKGNCANYFYENLRFRFNYNDGLRDISKINFYKDLNNDNSIYASTPISFNYTSTKQEDSNYHFYDFERKDFSSLEPNSNYKIKLVINYLGLDYEIDTGSSNDKTYAYNFLNNSTPEDTSTNIYTVSSTSVSCGEPVMGFASDSVLTLHLGDYTTTTSVISNESDTLYFTINNNELFRTLGASTSNLSVEGYVSGKDIFGRDLNSEKGKFNINYLNNPEFNNSEFKISDGTNELNIVHFKSVNGFIIEGAEIIFDSEIISYLGNVKLDLYRKSDNIDNLVYSEIVIISKPSISENETKINIPSVNYRFKYTRDEIKENKNVIYYIKMTNVENPELGAISSENSIDEVYQLNPILSNYLASWVPVNDTEGNYNVSFNLNRNFDESRIDNDNSSFDTELNVTQTYFQNSSTKFDTFKLNFEDSEKDKELLKSSIYSTNIIIKRENAEDSEGNKIFTPEIFNSWNIAYSELELIINYTVSFKYFGTDNTNTTLTFKLTKTGKTDRVLIYNILPTLSHRQNHLGINTPNVSNLSDAVLAISAYNNKTKIYLMGYENNNERTSIIDLSKGSFEGFEIDCGGLEDWMKL